MRRRLDLGASLVGSPRLLLLDEPTTGVDPASRIALWDTIRELVAAGTDVLLTTQYLEEADRLAADIVIIDRGLVIAAGTPAELKSLAAPEVIEVHLPDPASLTAAAEVLGRLDRRPSVDMATCRVTITAQGGPERLMYALRALDTQGVPVEDITLRRPTLDEVFLALTGGPAAHPMGSDTTQRGVA